MTYRHNQKPVPHTDASLNFMLKLSRATSINEADYSSWVRNNATELCIGFDRYMRDHAGDIHPSEQVLELAVYGRMQYTRSNGFGV